MILIHALTCAGTSCRIVHLTEKQMGEQIVNPPEIIDLLIDPIILVITLVFSIAHTVQAQINYY